MNRYRNYETCPDCGASAYPFRYLGCSEEIENGMRTHVREYKCMADRWHRFKVSKAEPEPSVTGQSTATTTKP